MENSPRCGAKFPSWPVFKKKKTSSEEAAARSAKWGPKREMVAGKMGSVVSARPPSTAFSKLIALSEPGN